jgi:hypothetical protein
VWRLDKAIDTTTPTIPAVGLASRLRRDVVRKRTMAGHNSGLRPRKGWGPPSLIPEKLGAATNARRPIDRRDRQDRRRLTADALRPPVTGLSGETAARCRIRPNVLRRRNENAGNGRMDCAVAGVRGSAVPTPRAARRCGRPVRWSVAWSGICRGAAGLSLGFSA